MKHQHLHRCHAGSAVHGRARKALVSAITSPVATAVPNHTTYPWLGTDMAFDTKGQRLKEHPG